MNGREINFSEFFKIIKKLQDHSEKILIKNQCFWMEENKIIEDDLNTGVFIYNIDKFNIDSIKKFKKINSEQIFVVALLYNEMFFSEKLIG